MERNEISEHEVRLFVALQKRGDQWATTKDLAAEAKIADRTARAHLLKLVRLNMLDVARVFPGHRYRLAGKADKRNQAYIIRLENAASVFGIGSPGRQGKDFI